MDETTFLCLDQATTTHLTCFRSRSTATIRSVPRPQATSRYHSVNLNSIHIGTHWQEADFVCLTRPGVLSPASWDSSLDFWLDWYRVSIVVF